MNSSLAVSTKGLRIRRATAYLSDPKIILIGIYLACDYKAVFERIDALGLSIGLIIYFALYAILTIALVAAAFIPSFTARICVAALLAAGSITLQGYEWATASQLDYNSFERLVSASGDAGSAYAQYFDVLVKAGSVAAILFAAISLPPRRGLPWHTHFVIPAGAVIMLSGMLFLRGGEGTRGLPAAFPPIAHATIKGVLALTEERGPRRVVDFTRPSKPPDHDVVLVIDESVAGNYLDINNSGGVHSGLASARAGFGIFNYGIAASITNCSAGSNQSLRFGGNRQNYRRIAKKWPSIWAYAHGAGMRTVYLDGQRRGGTLQNYMTASERAEIDNFVQFDGVDQLDVDHMIARTLAKHITNGVPEFILVNKIGAHFPVADKFPMSAATYGPLPDRGKTVGVIDMGSVHGSQKGTAAEWRLYRNAYRNTVAWNTGGFFDTLLPAINPKMAVIIYTSDHGQDLHERGNPGKGTHCVNDPLPEEGAVPLVAIDTAGSERLDWSRYISANRNGMSHFRIFPTLLALMGYKEAEISPAYGDNLVRGAKDPLTFTINYGTALGREPTWRKVEPAQIVVPPAADVGVLPNFRPRELNLR